MIKSMTAFSRAESHASEGHIIWELRSVNHRYLEPNFRLPEELRSLEPKLREQLRSRIARGKVEISCRFKAILGSDRPIQLNTPLVEQLIRAAEEVRKLTQHTNEINPTDILAWPNALIPPEPNLDLLEQEALSLFNQALNQLITGRTQEGQALGQLIQSKNQAILAHIQTITGQVPTLIEQHRAKLETKIAELGVKVDEERLEQELLLMVQKSDITEELDRLNTHCAELTKTLRQDKAIGRRLDFLLQEMNRETNTIGSKISDSTVTQNVVELKVLIEQIREQIQNIE